MRPSTPLKWVKKRNKHKHCENLNFDDPLERNARFWCIEINEIWSFLAKKKDPKWDEITKMTSRQSSDEQTCVPRPSRRPIWRPKRRMVDIGAPTADLIFGFLGPPKVIWLIKLPQLNELSWENYERQDWKDWKIVARDLRRRWPLARRIEALEAIKMSLKGTFK